jgi:hypothetical protein
MRIGGGIVSAAGHVALIAAGLFVIPMQPKSSESTPMMILPVELLTIAETTNVAPVAEEAPEDPIEEEATDVATAAESTAPEPAAAAEPEPIPEPAPAEKPEPKKPEPKPAPKAEKKESFEDSLAGILQSVDKTPPKARPAEKKAAANPFQSTDKPRPGVGDPGRMTITVADFIRDQLLRKGCWGDQDDMADAKRLRAVIRVRFERDGRLMGSPELIDPSRTPQGDMPMQVFIQRAYRALSKCSPFTVPPEYYAVSPAQWIDIEFLP